MKYYYDELNKKSQLKARLDYFDRYKETENMMSHLFRATFTAEGLINE